MDKKHFISLTLLFLFTISVFSTAAFAKDYSIPSLNMDLFPQDDGALHVNEVIHYSFTGTYNGVYRDIPISGNQQLKNIQVSAQGAYIKSSVSNSGGMERITVYLYSNPQKTVPITDKDVTVTVSYDFLHGMKFYNDVAELQYKLVGTQWDKDIGAVNANIHLKSGNGVQYWLNPPYFAENSSWNGNTLNVVGKTVHSGDYFELRMVIPKNQFAANPTNGIIINQDGLSQIEKIQNDYQNELNFKTNLYSLLAVLFLLACFIPLLIYFLYGREPKINYRAEYERDIPTDDLPAVVNAISGKGLGKKVGEPDMDGFRATIMDLINRKYLLMQDVPQTLDKDKDRSISLKVNPDKNLDELTNFEYDAITILKNFEEDGIINLDGLKNGLKDRNTAQSFRESYGIWESDLKSEFLNDGIMDQIFLKKGDTYLKIFGVIGLIAAALTFFFTISNPLPAASYALVTSIILGIVSIISLIMPQKVGGQWTTHGEEFDAKWHNFKKYIQDFSLIKEYPPESVKVWNKYLVYATALGVADKVRKSMEMNLPDDQLAQSDIFLFHYYGGYWLLASSLDAGMRTAAAANSNGSDFGGVGDIGGGFGGGGGGAF
jgi:uncharacterized membrane protein